jgi:A/G-specific adenine glycosylase
LPGVGPYTARAVLAFAFDRPVATLDTNVRRVLDRSVGPLPTSPRFLQSTADGLVPPDAAAAWGHALMDLGATVCVAGTPRCDACPIRAWCRTASRAAVELDSRSDRPRRGHVPFPSTTRWLRGRILDQLRDAPDGAWVAFGQAIGSFDVERVHEELQRLARERIVELDAAAATPPRARLPTS